MTEQTSLAKVKTEDSSSSRSQADASSEVDHKPFTPIEEDELFEAGMQVTSFARHLYNILHDDRHHAAIGWTDDGKDIIVHRPKLFQETVMPNYFNSVRYTSFRKQLENYEFKRVLSYRTGGVPLEQFHHPEFYRDCELMQLTKLTRSVSGRTTPPPVKVAKRKQPARKKRPAEKVKRAKTGTGNDDAAVEADATEAKTEAAASSADELSMMIVKLQTEQLAHLTTKSHLEDAQEQLSRLQQRLSVLEAQSSHQREGAVVLALQSLAAAPGSEPAGQVDLDASDVSMYFHDDEPGPGPRLDLTATTLSR